MIVLIFASGSLKKTAAVFALIDQAELIIAVDGGANHCSSLNIAPEILVGDFDSIDLAVLAEYEQKDTEIHRHPMSKDATDLELALDLALDRGTSTIWLLGGLGGRWDMSLSNIMLGASDKYTQCEMSLLGEDCIMHILRSQKTHSIHGKSGQTLSLLPLGGDVEGINISGFEYPLTDQTLQFGVSLGLSNVLTGDLATISFRKGVLLSIQLLSNPI